LIVSHDPGIARHVDRVVAIRDGMLASETIRQALPTANGAATTEQQEDGNEHYAELVVLDRAGRVHVPQEYLEQFNIKGRAQLEITDEGILIRPTELVRTEQVKVEDDGSGKSLPRMEHTGAISTKRQEKKGFFGRFGRKNSA
jgi:bifunctional DNA-binding transcriptional regulator/antitoxin component of YhaV-PrlF toxin-antitoxin module